MAYIYDVALVTGRRYPRLLAENLKDATEQALSQAKADDLAEGVPEPPKRRGRKPNPIRFIKVIQQLD